MTAKDQQIGGDHYKNMSVQPLELAYMRHGLNCLIAFQVKVDKYIQRGRLDAESVDELTKMAEDWEKAAHVCAYGAEIIRREL